MQQATSHILMIRPTSFAFNIETAINNTFQNISADNSAIITEKALLEFDTFVDQLRQEGVDVT
nr:arginine deiminase-related protein [Bacteroidota bacterium]